jgi:hypothetical protein
MNKIVAQLTQYDNETFDEYPQWIDEDSGEGVDFTGSTFTMQIRASREATVVEATPTLGVADIANGVINIRVAMGALDVGEYVYDLVRTNGTVRSVIMTGPYVVEPGVTELV